LGIITFDLGILIGAVIIVAIGLLIAQGRYGQKPVVAGIGWTVTIIGVLAALQGIWFNGFRELNIIAAILAVILLGVIFVRRVDGKISSVFGVLIVIVAFAALTKAPVINGIDIQWDNRVGVAFERGFNSLTNTLGLTDGSNSNRQNRNGNRNGR